MQIGLKRSKTCFVLTMWGWLESNSKSHQRPGLIECPPYSSARITSVFFIKKLIKKSKIIFFAKQKCLKMLKNPFKIVKIYDF